MGNIVAIVGRPNTGKSTLFNRLTESRQAIVDEVSGVTRDRNYGTVNWNGKEFSLIDTGGYLLDDEDAFNEAIRAQVLLAVDEADIILFLVDAKDGITPLDEDVARMLRSCEKPVLLVVNKVDNGKMEQQSAEFYALGMGDFFTVSAVNGSGTGDLLDAVVKDMKTESDDPDDDLPRIAVVGRPNVGKSSIINAFIGQDRNIVTPVAGTTRDSLYTRYKLFGFDFYLVDTAGVRKKSKVSENIEFYSVMRSIRAIEHSDVCLLMIDAATGLEAQDLNIFGLCRRNNKGVVLVVNKWDTVEKSANTLKEYEAGLRARLAPDNDIPIVFTSVIEKQRIFKVLEYAKAVYDHKSQRISTSRINEELLPILRQTPPPVYKGKSIKINYI
ncbi:MAG: ribosome biogenesis GTPase Der, partial [Bacteroidales bacterium]|nr:ribosome biogenesis GTPase Der [Bacteroidales bacterium]